MALLPYSVPPSPFKRISSTVVRFALSTYSQLQLPDGSAATPPYSFVNNTDMGHYRAGSNSLGTAVGGVAQVTINSTAAFSTNTTNLIDISPSSRSITAASLTNQGFIGIKNDISLVGGGAASLPPGYLFKPTVTYATGTSIFGAANLFYHGAVYKNANGVAMSTGAVTTLLDVATTQADGAAVTQLVGTIGIGVAPIFNTINSGTLAVGSFTPACGVLVNGILANTGVGSGATVTSYIGLNVGNLPVTGTLTAQTGLQIANLTSGTNSYGVRIGDAVTNALWVNDTNNSTDVAGGIVFGSSKDTDLYRSAASTLKTGSTFDAATYSVAGSAGASGSFTTVDGKTVTVTSGIITAIV